MTQTDLTFGYGVEALQAAFDAVKNPEHWKLPIDATIAEGDRAVTEAAIIFFTGSQPRFLPDHHNGHIRVTAAGYYAAIGA